MSDTAQTAVPAIAGWFTIDDEPALVGKHCPVCGTYAFPPTTKWCPNPVCTSESMDEVRLSRTATVWSYTDARYQPPPPYVTTTDPYEPFAIVAAELDNEKIIVLGQVADGFGLADLRIGAHVEIVAEPLYEVEGVPHLTWRWRPVDGGSSAREEA